MIIAHSADLAVHYINHQHTSHKGFGYGLMNGKAKGAHCLTYILFSVTIITIPGGVSCLVRMVR